MLAISHVCAASITCICTCICSEYQLSCVNRTMCVLNLCLSKGNIVMWSVCVCVCVFLVECHSP